MNRQDKPEIIFVFQNMLGGVASLNKNLINNASLKSKAYIKVILLRVKEWEDPFFTDSLDADEIVHFEYSSRENIYAVLKRLNSHFGDGPGAIFCNDKLEMITIYTHGSNKTIFQFIHDFYNLKLAVNYGAITDLFITHTELFRDVLISSDPANTKAYCIPHGVNIPAGISISEPKGNLKIVFAGRLTEGKGVHDLHAIDLLLKNAGISVDWTIIGRGALKEQLAEQWKENRNVRFASPETNEEVMKIMSEQDIFILPTRFEGSPVSILEAIANGLSPIVSDLPGGIREVVTEDIGARVPVGNNQLFADAIASLHNDRARLMSKRENARKLALQKFDIKETSNNYFRLLLQFEQYKKRPSALPPINLGFRLDKKWLPNSVVTFIRKHF